MLHWNNAQKIYANLTDHGFGGKMPLVHTWALYDKSFSFPRVRRYSYVQENMDMLEHFEDNLNLNPSNKMALDSFLKASKTVHDNLTAKYHDGEFADPKDTDPWEEKEFSWVTNTVNF